MVNTDLPPEGVSEPEYGCLTYLIMAFVMFVVAGVVSYFWRG